MSETYTVFVYGTLKNGERNHYLLEGATCLEVNCWTNGRLFDTGNGYPCICIDGMRKVYGELYKVTKEQLKQLDILEGYLGEGLNNHYERIKQDVFTEEKTYSALIYIYPLDNTTTLIELTSGKW
ncbi:hypothetical protein CIB95_07935 [Lottiidibacillus patelloidae]|uniref:Gamma-glutamylcyclotransferase family protein n=1 Tax=Lottiidibacillus patelloidae TaxID=2670334 RepID=A0A263BV10_9BACI|nr:gamma-glutamylcyclotransferase family protein [Lottiidibacillus patelloidae]OZM57382.1 hypothetical protein CIB95_07935 [Lottiidibacillus patelloidae]